MRIAIHSASTAVQHVLEAAISLAGHEYVPVAEAELCLCDTLHPPQAVPLPPTPRIWLGGNDAGALSVPLSVATLVQAITRAANPILPLAEGWRLDRAARALTHPQHPPQAVTEKECALLAALATQPEAISREQLLSDVWGMAEQAETHTLETHIYRLRAKLGAMNPPPGDLVTEDGSYRLLLA